MELVGRICRRQVAPLAGAWIETWNMVYIYFAVNVAPLAGAWIETKKTNTERDTRTSHPSRVRGLKHGTGGKDLQTAVVAPLAGAWIETTVFSSVLSKEESHPSRVRGLKPSPAQR